jgi:DNA polymerase
MPSEREQLVDAAINHLTSMKAGGRRFISLAPETIEALNRPPEPSPSLTGKFIPAAPPSPSVAIPAKPSPVPMEGSTTIKTSGKAAGAGGPVTVVAPANGAGSPSLNKTEALKELRERALVCMKCQNLAAARTNVVFGVGSADAQLMFVGEAPGADEDRQGEPFVGAAGQLLTKIIQTMGLSRETVYIANILKCRPDTPGQASGNRKPTADEMRTCIPYLHSQIDIIQPKVLVALGATAVEGLLGQAGGISRLRGNWQEYRGIPLMPTFHPAYLLRNMALSEKRKVWEDMLLVMEKLGMPVSEKQRGFFLSKS